MKALVVDDSTLIRERVISILNKLDGVEKIVQASLTSEAILSIKSEEFDVAIIDLRLPDENGLRILEKIKRLKPHIKTIILTNYPFPQYMQRSEQLGADYFLHKLTDFDELKSILTELSKQNIAKS